MKSGREHRVPLADAAVIILKKMESVRENAFVFSGKHVVGLTAHGARSDHTARIQIDVPRWAAESTNFPSEAAEIALAHAVGSKVEAAYRRGDMIDKRRLLMPAWAEFCTRGQATADVVPARA